MDKSPDAYRTISEVADELGLPQHVLRFWETRFPQIKPLKRGGGRRYYRPDDIDLVRGIQTLLYSEGYTIKGVQRILKEDGVKPVQMVGRGSAFAGERPDMEEPDDDVFTADEMEEEEETVADLRATRNQPQREATSTRQEPMLTATPSSTTTPSEHNDEPMTADLHVPKAKARSQVARKGETRRDHPLRIALSELQECARLVELLREKA
jgi:DNA-binding transcriptional MerR regulator